MKSIFQCIMLYFIEQSETAEGTSLNQLKCRTIYFRSTFVTLEKSEIWE